MTINIPKYIGSQQVKGPTNGGLLSPQATNASFGDLQAKAGEFAAKVQGQNVAQVTGLGKQILELGAQLKHRSDVTLAKSTYNTASDEMRKTLSDMYNVTDAKGVAGLPATADAEIQRIFEKHAKDLTPEQAQLIKPMWDQKRASALDGIQDYARNQMNVIETQQDKLQIQGAVEEASFHYKDPSQLQQKRDEIDVVINSMAKRENMSPEQKKAVQLQSYTTLHASVVQTALSERNIGFANRYFNEKKGELSASSRTTMQNQLRRVEDTEVVNVTADDVMAKHGTEQAAVEYVRDKYKNDPLRNEIEKEVESRWVDARRFEEQKKVKQFEVGFAAVSSSESYVDASRKVKEFEGAADDRVALEQFAATRFKTELATINKEVKRQQELLVGSRRIDMEQRIGEFNNEYEVQRHAMKIGLDDEGMQEVLTTYREGGVSKNITLGKVKTAAKNLGIELDTSDTILLHKLVQRDFENTDKAITSAQLDEKVINYFVEGERKRSWTPGFGSNKTYFDSVKEGKQNDWLPDLSEYELTEMKQAVGIQNRKSKSVPGDAGYIDPSDELKLRGYYRSAVMGMPNETEMDKRRSNAVRVAKEEFKQKVTVTNPLTQRGF